MLLHFLKEFQNGKEDNIIFQLQHQVDEPLQNGLNAPLASEIKDFYNLKDNLIKATERMAKTIKDVAKAKRRMNAISKAIETIKLNSKNNPDKNYVFCTRNELKTICFEFDSMNKIIAKMNETYPTRSKNYKDAIYPYVHFMGSDVEEQLQSLEKKLKEIFQNRINELEQLLS
jgi:hypothetical protein